MSVRGNGHRLETLRRALGLTHEALARMVLGAEADAPALAALEAEGGSLSLVERHALAVALGVPRDALSHYLGGHIELGHLLGMRAAEEPPGTVRETWDSYFLRIAEAVAVRATCDRKHVGAVIERNRHILATGYNGSIVGLEHCDEVGHMMEDGHCVRTIHAEANAIVQAARHGARIEGANIYVTASPCWPCFKMIANAGIVKIVYGEFYRDGRIHEAASACGIQLVGPAPREGRETTLPQ